MTDINQRLGSFASFLDTASREDLVWIHGYLSGKLGFSGGSAIQPAGGSADAARTKVSKFTLAYGTETGNSKSLATALAKKAKAAGFQVKLVGLDQFRLKDLSKESYFFLIVSTQGDGEPPQAALGFFEYIQQASLDLSAMHYAVLGLGDTAYPQFCQAAVDADTFLTARGAKRLLPVVKCDTVYEDEANKWLTEITRVLENVSAAPSVAATAAAPASTARETYLGEVITNINLIDLPSTKQTHHIEIRCENEIDYAPGDAAGFVPVNPSALVERVLGLLGADGTEAVTYRGATQSLHETLSRKVNIAFLSERVIRKYGELISRPIEGPRMGLDALLEAHPPGSVDRAALLEIMDPIVPRLYSISSSPATHSGELHLTVARHNFPSANGAVGEGLCSSYLCQLGEGTSVEFYIHKNRAFKLPAPETDIIMVGPGTGIAPFRSFLFERDALGATGRNWLFFGERNFVTDFLYQTELLDFLKTGVLHRLDVAFSRDQEQKLYVQHRLQENAAEVFQWMESGAHIYVCGAKTPMSVDVENTFLEIIQDQGKLNPEQARSYLDGLAEQGRYLKDVY